MKTRVSRYLVLVAVLAAFALVLPVTQAGWSTVELRASAITSGTSGQDPAVSIRPGVAEAWVVFNKTAEANGDNLLDVRLQAKVGTVWVDVPYTSHTITGLLTSATDITADVTAKTNIVTGTAGGAAATYTTVAHYKDLPSNVLRTVWIASGTTPGVTWSAQVSFQ